MTSTFAFRPPLMPAFGSDPERVGARSLYPGFAGTICFSDESVASRGWLSWFAVNPWSAPELGVAPKTAPVLTIPRNPLATSFGLKRRIPGYPGSTAVVAPRLRGTLDLHNRATVSNGRVHYLRS